MLRLALIQLILFCTPFVMYGVYRALARRLDVVSHGHFDQRPMQYLILAGGALCLVGLAVMALLSGERGDTVYIPAHLENGELVPGRFVPAEEAGALQGLDPKERANPGPPGRD